MKTITLDYEEYLKLEEKANLNQSTIDKKIQKIRKEYIDGMQKEIKMIKEQLKNDYNYQLNTYKKVIRKLNARVKARTNIFGYIKSKRIIII